MSFLIECPRSHLAIKSYGPVTLSDFTVLTGRNGTGKSQTCDAIKNGQIIAKKDADHLITKGAIFLLRNKEIEGSLNNFVVHSYLADGHGGERGVESKYLNPDYSMLKGRFGSIRANLIGKEIANAEHMLKPDELADRTIPDILQKLASFAADQERPTEFRDKATEIVEDANRKLLNSNPSFSGPELDAFIAIIRDIQLDANVEPIAVTSEHFEEYLERVDYGMFSPALEALFGNYRDLQIENKLALIEDMDEGTKKGLSKADFIEKYGHKPWEMLSESLKHFGLNYTFSEPPSSPKAPYRPHLVRNDDGRAVDLTALSSGEKVLLRFALALFRPDRKNVNLIKPDLVILDEVDGPLHPDVLAILLQALTNFVVGELGIKCIVVTHSPVSVAMSDEESIYEIPALGEPPTKVPKISAMNALLRGIPSVSVEWESNRNVFVESSTDAEIYHDLLQRIKAKIEIQRSLHFLSTGIVKKDGVEAGAGCAAVAKIVSQLQSTGNRSIYGLVDWDRKAETSGNIQVLAEGLAYSLENIVLNPMLIGCLLLKEKRESISTLERFADLGSALECQLQGLSDEMVRSLYNGKPPISDKELMLMNDMKIRLPSELLTMNGHDLENKMADAHPYLQKYTRAGSGKLMRHISLQIIHEYPDFCPQVIADAFISLANADPANP